jgi:hypothetical protein
MRTRIPLVLIVLVALSVRADQADVPALIQQLADDAPRTRDLASVQLRKLGREPIPALREALKSDDPEVASRAKAIIKGIEEDADPRKPMYAPRELVPPREWGPNQIGVAPPLQQLFQTARRDVIVNDNGRMIRITEGVDGITILSRDTRDGRDQVKITRAATAEELQREHPAEYLLYARYYLAPRATIENRNLPRTIEDARRLAEEHRQQVLERQQKMRDQLEEARRQMIERQRQRDE